MAKTTFVENELLSLLLKGTVSNQQANATKLPVLLQPDGTFRAWSVLVGVDPDGRERQTLTDSNRILRMRPYEAFEEIVITDLGIVWTVCAENSTANSIMLVWVEIWKYATDVVTSGVDIRFDDGVAQHEIVHNLQVMAQAPGHKYGPYHLTNGWSVDMRTNVANRCRCIATIEHYGLDEL